MCWTFFIDILRHSLRKKFSLKDIPLNHMQSIFFRGNNGMKGNLYRYVLRPRSQRHRFGKIDGLQILDCQQVHGYDL